MNSESKVRKAFVAGWPISHSLSPVLHGYWLEKYGIPGSYEAIAVQPEDISAFIHSVREQGFAGGNVTIPHKEAVINLADRTEPAAEVIGAANTVWLDDENQLRATNTDAIGFASNLDDFASDWRKGKTAIVLGAGGAARAVIYAILDAGYETVHILNRTESRAKELAERFGRRCTPHDLHAFGELSIETDFLVNTTSIGMSEHTGNFPLAIDNLPAHCTVSDIVYVPLETPLLRDAKARGLKTVDGLGMLLHQAAPGFEKWFGILPKVDSGLRQHVLGAMKSKSGPQ